MLLVKRSVIRALDAAVDAADTGCLGLELRRDGESFGGGSRITAVSVWLVSLFRFGLYRRAERVTGVFARGGRSDRGERCLLREGGRTEGEEVPRSEARRVLGWGNREVAFCGGDVANASSASIWVSLSRDLSAVCSM